MIYGIAPFMEHWLWVVNKLLSQGNDAAFLKG